MLEIVSHWWNMKYSRCVDGLEFCTGTLLLHEQSLSIQEVQQCMSFSNLATHCDHGTGSLKKSNTWVLPAKLDLNGMLHSSVAYELAM